jgi:hypothetical protein
MPNVSGANCAAGSMPNTPPESGAASSCSTACPTDFTLNAPCRIIRSKGGTLTISAAEISGFSGGTFTWSTGSANVTLSATTGSRITVTAADAVSSGRDAEVITVVRSATGCADITKTVALTVGRIKFSADTAAQRYGYDDFDTPAVFDDDHFCIKQSDYTTIHVEIEGGLTADDFTFVCDTASLATVVAPAGSSFDLRVNAGATNKGKAFLQAKCKCPAKHSFNKINCCVYKERVVDVVVAKIDHPTVANRSLRFPTADYAAHAATANAKLKEAVVKYNITNFDAANGITGVTFTSGTGILTYDIAAGGGADLTAIGAAMTGTGTKVRVAIIRGMKSMYYLNAATVAGATTIVLKGAAGKNFLKAGNSYPIGSGATAETVTVVTATQASATITCSPLTNAHAAGEGVEFNAAGWSSNPILIMEGSASLDVAKWTILHEVGHRNMTLDDVDDATNFMHFQQSWTDYRLRYCPRIKKYDSANKENQWEKIPRT